MRSTAVLEVEGSIPTEEFVFKAVLEVEGSIPTEEFVFKDIISGFPC